MNKMKFWPAFAATICLAILANALPYLNSRHAYQHDGWESAGFPFSFHKVSGDCWPSACDDYAFHLGYFAADVMLALLFAVAIALVFARKRKKP